MLEKETISEDRNEESSIRAVVEALIQDRLQTKLDKLKEGEEDKREKLIEEHQRKTWLADAARRVSQIQMASHTVKPIHPDARGTNIYLLENQCADRTLIGTHLLGEDRADDVVGNAAALDVFKFLKLSCNGKTILARAVENDPALLAALSDDAEEARTWINAFTGIVEGKTRSASHTLAKQVYFPLRTGGYHLLAPLFPTALVHSLHGTLQADRFSEAAKDARAAHREKNPWHEGYREYPDLAVQNFGGSKPQNISQLNSERGGVNHLLPSLPPIWHDSPLKPPMRHKSIFTKYGPLSRDHNIGKHLKALRNFLVDTRDWSNIKIRNRRADFVAEIIDLVLDLAARIREKLPSGWSNAAECRLDAAERYWLDFGTDVDLSIGAQNTALPSSQTDWVAEIASRFANWLNAAIITERTPMGDEEYREWKILLKEELNTFREEIAR